MGWMALGHLLSRKSRLNVTGNFHVTFLKYLLCFFSFPIFGYDLLEQVSASKQYIYLSSMHHLDPDLHTALSLAQFRGVSLFTQDSSGNVMVLVDLPKWEGVGSNEPTFFLSDQNAFQFYRTDEQGLRFKDLNPSETTTLRQKIKPFLKFPEVPIAPPPPVVVEKEEIPKAVVKKTSKDKKRVLVKNRKRPKNRPKNISQTLPKLPKWLNPK